MSTSPALPTTVDAVIGRLADVGYLADRRLGTAVFLALTLRRPLFLEGEPGVGKTELAKALASVLGASLLRVQCYEGLDIAQTAYEWNVARQMMEIRLAEAAHGVTDPAARERLGKSLYSREMLIERPLLEALTQARSPVLLIDELDRADDEFDAFLLELLSDWQLTIPEVGTIRATRPPVVVITSNRTRELHDALKRRCLYHWIDYPTLEKELQIVATRLPGTPERLALQVCAFVQALRRHDLWKVPGVAETLDWTSALLALGVEELSQPEVPASLGCILKHQDDVQRVRSGLFNELLTEVTEASPIPAAPGVVVRDTPVR